MLTVRLSTQANLWSSSKRTGARERLKLKHSQLCRCRHEQAFVGEVLLRGCQDSHARLKETRVTLSRAGLYLGVLSQGSAS